MKTQFNSLWTMGHHWASRLAVITFLLGLTYAKAQPTIVSTVPASGATGVSISNAVVFTFSEAMDVGNSAALFYNESMTNAPVPVSLSWNASNTVLTCTPEPSFPASSIILWMVQAKDTGEKALSGKKTSYFVTGAAGGGSGGGSGTNQYTSFVVGTAIYYDQPFAGAPMPDPSRPYFFLADLTLASNRTALSATVTLPNASVSNLNQQPFSPEEYTLGAQETNETNFDATFGSGNYLFTVTAATSNQMVNVDLSASLTQPSAPDLSNYAAMQSVDSTQPLTLQWGAFTGGTSSDYIVAAIGGGFSTPQPGDSNALTGTATSVLIPAGTLQPNMSYEGTLGFFRVTLATNNSYTTAAIRESITQFTLITTDGVTTPLVLTNVSRSGHTISFNITSGADQNMTIQYNTNLNLAAGPWKTLLATNSATGVIQVTDSVNTTNPSVFYRALIGP